jgi:hypothetical protein
MAGVVHDNLTGCRMANLKKYLNIHDPLQIQVPSELTLFVIHHQRKVIGALSAVGTSIGRISLCAPWGVKRMHRGGKADPFHSAMHHTGTYHGRNPKIHLKLLLNIRMSHE